MPTTEYLKIPRERVGVLIGTKGSTKAQVEKETQTHLEIDSEAGTVSISPTKESDDPLSVWKARYIVKAIGRGFNPDIALKLNDDEVMLDIINLPDYVGRSKKAVTRQKSRIIGKDGRTRDIITDMAEVDVSIYGKTVSIIGKMENLQLAHEAVEMILNGSRHKTVYAFLEKKKHDRRMREFQETHKIIDL
ncbi:MAG TPA: KH domain-containing protein [Methanobacteriaceae archaeon]|nr:KH domain-containing protein [Methanobacteriaceae archaeon]